MLNYSIVHKENRIIYTNDDGESLDYLSSRETFYLDKTIELFCSIDDKPSYTKYYENGNPMYEIWHDKSIIHRVLGPAYIQYFKDSKIAAFKFYRNGKLHNETGSASIIYTPQGGLSSMEYYYNGDRMPTEIECASLGIKYLKPKEWLYRKSETEKYLKIYE